MSDLTKIEQLLTEIRDLHTRHDQRYSEYLAKSELMYQKQFDEARKRAMINRPFQWLSLGIVVYVAVYCALRSIG
ncbi:MAG TPA: hypothetical protein VGK58_00155 [Lacipirellulaceae bacterium]